MSVAPPSPSPSTGSSGKSKKSKGSKGSNPTNDRTATATATATATTSTASDRERFTMEGAEEDWQVIAEAATKQQQTKPSSKATVEEIHSGDENAAQPAAVSNATKKSSPPQKNKKSTTVPAGLTPTQRKALAKSNKNPHTGGSMKSNAVEIEDGEESDDDEEDGLINEEDEGGVSGLSDADGASASESEGEASWERDDAVQIIKKKPDGAPTAPWTLKSILIWVAVIGVIVGLIWIRLQDQSIWDGIDPDDVDVTSKPPTEQEDYYAILGVERTADLKQIKANYRKLVLKSHPDKNPDCQDCTMKFQQVQRAYDVLSNKEKRSMYDSIETTYEVLKSDTVELTSSNFESEVLHKDAVWVIQVYTDWHKSAIRFSQAWEEAALRYGKLVSFGRIHAYRERELTKTLPVKFGVIPTVLIYANGQFSQSKTFLDSGHAALSKLADFIAENFPNTVQPVGNTVKEIQAFLKPAEAAEDQARVLFIPDFEKQSQNQARRQRPAQAGSHQQRFQQQMLQAQPRDIDAPSLTYKAIARKFQYAIEFGQVQHVKGDKTKWKQWLKDVSQAVKLTPPSSLPAFLYVESDESSPKWLSGSVDKDKLLAHVSGMYQRTVPWMNSHMYSRQCVETRAESKKHQQSNVCVLALACEQLKIGELEFNSFASGAKALRKQAAFRNVPLQFAKVDATKQTDMEGLCQALTQEQKTGLSIVVLMNHGSDLYHFGAQSSQQFDSWLQHVVKQDGTVKPVSAPYIPVIHIPDDVLPVTLPSVGQIFVPLKWLYGGGILIGLVFAGPWISAHFGKFLYFIFALSIIVPGFELLKDVYDKYYMH